MIAEQLTLSDLEQNDPCAPLSGRERRFLCPFAACADKRDPARHRSLAANTLTGLYFCHRCHAEGLLGEYRDRTPNLHTAKQPDPDGGRKLGDALRKVRPLEGGPGATYLQGRGFEPEACNGTRFTPNLSGRPAICWAVKDLSGKTVALHGRHTDGRKPKAHTLGSLSEGAVCFMSVDACRDASPLALMEAPLDALACHTATGRPSVALCGMSLRPWLCDHLMGRTALLAFDADEPGEKAALEWAAGLRDAGATPLRLRPPAPFKDWAEALQKLGADGLRAAMPEPEPIAVAPAQVNQVRADAKVTCLPVDEWASRTGTELEWLVPGVIPKRSMTLVSAAQKIGKSTLLRNLIAVVSTSGEFLGRTVEGGRTVYLPLEENPAAVLSHLRSLGADLRSVVVPSVTRIHDFTDTDGTAQHLEETQVLADAAAVEQVVRAERPVLLAVDPLVRLVRCSDLNDYGKVYAALDPLLRLALVYGLAVVLVHHEGKNAADRENVGHRAVGSVALPGIVGATLSMTKRGDVRTLENEGRGVDDLGKLVLDFDPTAGRLTCAGTWAELACKRAGAGLLEAAAPFGEPFTRTELIESCEGKRADLHRAFDALLKSERLTRVSGAGRKGDPNRYALADSGTAGTAGTAGIGRTGGSADGSTDHKSLSVLPEPAELAELAAPNTEADFEEF